MMSNEKKHLDLSAVLESDMCIGCGACTMADRSLTLELSPDSLIYQPNGLGNPAAAAVCPAISVDFDHLHEKVFPGSEVTGHGVVERVVLAQSTNEERNLKASSGGLIKEMLRQLLSRDDVDGILALDEISGLDYRVRLISHSDEIDELPGSIYHAVPLDDTLRLLSETQGRFVVVGIPCQLEGMYNYIFECDPDLVNRISFTVGLLCGWLYSHHAVEAISQYKRIDSQKIEKISYRGSGPVGKLQITTPGKTTAIGRRVDFGYQVAFDRSFNAPRCHLCINHSNFLADVVVGDAWLPSTVTTRTGISLVTCRTTEASDLINELEQNGSIVVAEASVDDITESQTRRVVFGDFAYAYAEHLDRIDSHHPAMIGPNRPFAELRPEEEAVFFHKELVRKRELQANQRYRFLWWRKATKELPRHLRRYWSWFVVRVLRIKSLTGTRQEISRSSLKSFK